MKKFSLAMCAFALIATSGAFAATTPLKGSELLSQAKVSLAEARSIALKKEHGTVVDQELEKESGGSGLRYSFDIKVGNVVHEVGIDAKTGAVLEDSLDKGND